MLRDGDSDKKFRICRAGAERNDPDLMKQMPCAQSSTHKPFFEYLDTVIEGMT